LRIGPYILPSAVVLAPMAGVTDRPFRVLCRRLGAGLAASEMITSDTRPVEYAQIAPSHDTRASRAARVQLAGADPQALADAARANVALGAQIIDLNMGCRPKKCAAGCVVRRAHRRSAGGAHSAGGVNAVDVPVTLKIRPAGTASTETARHCMHRRSSVHRRARGATGRTRADFMQERPSTTTIRAIKVAGPDSGIRERRHRYAEKARREVLDFTGADE